MLEEGEEAIRPLFPNRHRGDRRDPEALLEGLQPGHHPPLPGFVRHVDGEHERNLHLGELRGDHQGAAHVLGVAHLQDPRAGFPHQDVPRDPLVLGHRKQGVHPGGVDHLDRSSPVARLPAGDFHRRAGIVRHVHVPPGEGAENDALPDVGISHQDHCAQGLQGGPRRVHRIPSGDLPEAHFLQNP